MPVTLAASLETYTQVLKSITVTNKQNTLLGEKGFAQSIDLVIQNNSSGNKIAFIGNGGSAGIASHMGTDFFKNGHARTVTFNDPTLITCLANDYSYTEIFSRPIEQLMVKGDILIAISSSGRSPNILNGANAALNKGCHLVTLSGFDADNPLRQLGELNFYVPSHSYAHVENAHLLICHTMVDALMARRKEL